MSVHHDHEWFVAERNRLFTKRWDGNSCPACGGVGRIPFSAFSNWTRMCGARYRNAILPEWWKHKSESLVDGIDGIKDPQSWLAELVRRWVIEREVDG